MEIADVDIVRDFEAAIKYLENPSLTRLFSVSGIQSYSFWKLGVLITAIFTTFRSLVNAVVLVVLRVSSGKTRISSVKPINCSLKPLVDDHDVDFGDCESCSSSSESDNEDLDSILSDEDRQSVDEDFHVSGSSYYIGEEHPNQHSIGARCFSWSDFTSGKSVVQLWDKIGLGLSFQESLGIEIPIWNLDSFYSWGLKIPAMEISSSPLTLSARTNNSKSIGLNTYDTRMGRQIPAMKAEWSSRLGCVVSLTSGGVEKVYVKDCTGNVTVGDLRNVKLHYQHLGNMAANRSTELYVCN